MVSDQDLHCLLTDHQHLKLENKGPKDKSRKFDYAKWVQLSLDRVQMFVCKQQYHKKSYYIAHQICVSGLKYWDEFLYLTPVISP